MLKELYEQARSLEGEKVWPTYDGKLLDRKEFLSSSEIGRCIRWSFFSKYPEKYPLPVGKGGNNGFAERGHAIEAHFVEKIKHLEQIGYKFEYVGDDQRSFYDADLGLSGTPDGVMTTPDGRKFLLELKSIDPRFNKANLPKKGHIPQTQQNMYLVEKCLNIKFDGGILFYIDASDVWNVKEFAVSGYNEIVEWAQERANQLWEATDPEMVEAEGLYSGDCDLCPFTHHCSQHISTATLLAKAKEAGSPFLESLEPTELKAEERGAIYMFLDARASEKEHAKEKEEVEDEVKQMVMEHDGLIRLEDGTCLVATLTAGRATIDKALLVGKGIDLDEVTKLGKPFITMNVKEPKQ